LTRQHTRLNYRPTRPNPIFYPVKAFDEETSTPSETTDANESKNKHAFLDPPGVVDFRASSPSRKTLQHVAILPSADVNRVIFHELWGRRRDFPTY